MFNKIQRPIDPYSKDWNLYWAQNPNLRRGVGAEANAEGDGDDPVTVTKEEFEAAQESLRRLEAKNQELLDENKKVKGSLKNWDGLDPDSVKKMLKNFEENEDMKLIAEGKYEDVINKRTEKAIAEYNSKIENLSNEKTELEQKYTKSQELIRDLMIDTSVVTEFVEAGGYPSASEDIKLRAKLIWKIEEGEAVPRDPNTGKLLQGKTGVMTKKEWVESLKESAPHLFPESQGAGASGNRPGKTVTGIDAKIEAARKAGNIPELRRLKAQKTKMEQDA